MSNSNDFYRRDGIWTGHGTPINIDATDGAGAGEAYFDQSAAAALSLWMFDGTAWAQIVAGGGQPEASSVLHVDGTALTYLSAPRPSWSLGDLDVRVWVAADDWTSGVVQTLFANTGSAGSGLASWQFLVNAAGKLAMSYSTDGNAFTTVAATTNTPGAVDGQGIGLRLTYAIATGAVNFYTSTDWATWTSFDTKTTGTTALHTTTALLSIGLLVAGTQPFVGTIYKAELRSSIGGTVIASPDFTGRWTGVDAQSNVWTINGAGSYWKPVTDLLDLRSDVDALAVPRVFTTTSTSTLTPEKSTYDGYVLTAQAAGLTIANHSTSVMSDFQQIRIRIKDSGTGRAISYGTEYDVTAAGGYSLPSTTTAGKWMELGFEWWASLSKFVMVALVQQT